MSQKTTDPHELKVDLLLESLRRSFDNQETVIRGLRSALEAARSRVDDLAAQCRSEKARADALEIQLRLERNAIPTRPYPADDVPIGPGPQMPRPMTLPTEWVPPKQPSWVNPKRVQPTEHWMHRAK